MRKTRNPEAADALLQQMWDWVNQEEREPGIHVYDLTNCLRKAWARKVGLVPEDARPMTRQMLLFLVGKLAHIVTELGRAECHPHVDGIVGSIDRLDEIVMPGEDGQLRVSIPGEVKTTRARARYGPSESYVNQLAAYCAMLGVRWGRLYILHLIEPAFECWDIEFDQDELDGWWEELLRRKRVLEASLAASAEAGPAELSRTMPDLAEHATWECLNCPVRAHIGCSGGSGRWVSPFAEATAFEEV